MPVFVSAASSSRDSRINPAQTTPLPRRTPKKEEEDAYEVVVAGSGPAGIMMSVLLARYGVTSVLTVDASPAGIHAGQADGLQPRTLEVLQSLDLAHEVLSQGCRMHEVAFWNADSTGKIERTTLVPDIGVPARFSFETTIHQGRIERVLSEDLEKHGGAVQRGWTVTGFEVGDGEWPVSVKMRGEDGERTVRCKYLIGADGAHSVVRRGMGLSLEGDTTDHIWGVVDAVVDTDFPDIRKRCAIHSEAGSIMVIPRERISGNKVLTRIYCQMEDDVDADPAVVQPSPAHADADAAHKAKSKARREKVTLERITTQARKVLAPYEIAFSNVDWWAAYQIGQRVTKHFSSPDLRVHIAGDACHTHSPKAGQGMNVSMMDAFNLSWKLSHVILGLAPPSLLATYETERLAVAQELIAFDTEFSTMFSGRIDAAAGLAHDDFVGVFCTRSAFASGCGIEYRPNLLVDADTRGVIADGLPVSGLLWPGRRLANVKTRRFADANPRDIHDDMPTTGVYRVLVLLPAAFPKEPAAFKPLLEKYAEAVPDRFSGGVVEPVFVFPGERGRLEWTDFPAAVKRRWEWLVLGDHDGTAYSTYGVSAETGAVAVVRPDGVVGAVGRVDEVEVVENWLGRVLVPAAC